MVQITQVLRCSNLYSPAGAPNRDGFHANGALLSGLGAVIFWVYARISIIKQASATYSEICNIGKL